MVFLMRSYRDEDFNWMATKGLVSIPGEPTMNNLILQYPRGCLLLIVFIAYCFWNDFVVNDKFSCMTRAGRKIVGRSVTSEAPR